MHTHRKLKKEILESRKSYLKALRRLYGSVKHRMTVVSKKRKNKYKRKKQKELNRLKYHRNRIKDMFYSVTLANDKDWRQLKNDAKAVYKAASDVVLKKKQQEHA